MTITIYGRPGCGKCERTKKIFDKEGVPYQEENIDEAEISVQELIGQTGQQFSQLPLVKVDRGSHIDWWGDFRIDRIKATVVEYHGQHNDEQ